MDKLIHQNNSVTISNDGATILQLLDIIHPAAKTLVDIAKSQDNEVGDGTTSVVVLAGELLKESKQFVEEGMHPSVIIKGYREAAAKCIERIKDVSIKIADEDTAQRREILKKCAQTSLNSKIISKYKEFFSEMVVDAVEHLEADLDKNFIGIKKVTGGSVTDSFLVEGVAFRKTFSYAGFEQQPKSFTNPKIVLLNVELELKSEKENAEVRLDNPDDYQKVVDAEWKIIYEKLEKIVASGAQVILSRLPVGDLGHSVFRRQRSLQCRQSALRRPPEIG